EDQNVKDLTKRVAQLDTKLLDARAQDDIEAVETLRAEHWSTRWENRRQRQLLAARRVEFTRAREEALQLIHENSRLADFFGGTITERAQHFCAVPWRKIKELDIETIVRFCEVLALRSTQEELEAVQLIGVHLLDMLPEDYRVT